MSNTAFARSHFAYDSLSRLTASWRDEQAGKGEWFGYHPTGQLTDVAYNADNVSNGIPQNATRTVNYAMTADTLNRSTMTDTGEPSVYTPNALNQYTDVNGGGVYYDGSFNLMWTGGFSAGYDADKRLTAIGSGENYGLFVYDGLGRCLKRTIDWETIIITYDGWKPIVEWDEWNGLKAWNVYGPGVEEILYRHDAYLGLDLRSPGSNGRCCLPARHEWQWNREIHLRRVGWPTVTDWNGENPRPYSWYGNRFMFTGREYFAGLGLYDYRFRFYHPILGRFLESDPIGFRADDANLFRYCGGDPVNGRDPYGLADENSTKPPVPKQKDYWGTPAGQAELASMTSTGPIDVHTTELPNGSRDINSLDRSGAARGEGSARDGGGGEGTLYAQNRPPPNPTPPIPSPYGPWYQNQIEYYKRQGQNKMLAGVGAMGLGAISMVRGAQVPGAILFTAGLATALYGYGEYQNAEQKAADDVSGR